MGSLSERVEMRAKEGEDKIFSVMVMALRTVPPHGTGPEMPRSDFWLEPIPLQIDNTNIRSPFVLSRIRVRLR
ncbi:hypothetical protein TIFTF001_007302 [Ficus carica]|uniref:Uncharacterized protein n=1 Tax=Ficus carica TaxID=3494 RepID=A0AA87ZQ43_FICCA|nr:hypothetical protein TIFTF001_007302 [Ficus carica]